MMLWMRMVMLLSLAKNIYWKEKAKGHGKQQEMGCDLQGAKRHI